MGGVPDKTAFIEAMNQLYTDKALYQKIRDKGIGFSKRPEFDWDQIAVKYAQEISALVGRRIRVREEVAASA